MQTAEQQKLQQLELALIRTNGIALALAGFVACLPGADGVDIDAAMRRARGIAYPGDMRDASYAKSILEAVSGIAKEIAAAKR